MSVVSVPFAIRNIGYDQDQVDRYINKLAAEYTNLQKKYTDLFSRFDAQSKQLDVSMNALSKAIVEAEARAIQIVAEAKNEAAQIKGSAHIELERIQHEKDRAVSEIFEMIKGLKNVVPFSIGEI